MTKKSPKEIANNLLNKLGIARSRDLEHEEGSSLFLTHEAFPFDKMVPGLLDLEMIEDTVKILNEATKDKVQVYLIINNRRRQRPLIAEKIADRLHSERQQGLF